VAAGAESRDRALEELLIAEGSDWFWWYGDDHSSDHDADFDALFRRHLRNAYTALGAPIPEELFAANISTGSGPDPLRPAGLLSITLDGKDTSYLEWAGAVAPPLVRPGGAMHESATATLITDVRIGVSRDALCVRLTGTGLISSLAAGASLSVVVAGEGVRVVPIERSWTGVGTIYEAAIPFAALAGGERELQFAIQVQDRSGAVLETVPHGRCWILEAPEFRGSGVQEFKHGLDWQP
jgi:hypothetical protein